MPKTITITLAHDLGKDEARRRVEAGFDRLKSAIAGDAIARFERNWESEYRLAFNGRGLGQSATGFIDVFPQHVRITATVPTLLGSLAEIVAGRVEAEGKLMLEKK